VVEEHGQGGEAAQTVDRSFSVFGFQKRSRLATLSVPLLNGAGGPGYQSQGVWAARLSWFR
jgi:hypothetical protein